MADSYYVRAIHQVHSLGVPQPYDTAVVVAFIVILGQKIGTWLYWIISAILCCKKASKNANSNYAHNVPDFSELGSLNSAIKNLQKEMIELKKEITRQGENQRADVQV